MNFWMLAFSANFCPIKTDLSGNTVWPQASGFQKLNKMDHFWHFELTFVHSKCKRSSIRSQCWMRLFLWFSNNVVVSFILCFWALLRLVISDKYFKSSKLKGHGYKENPRQNSSNPTVLAYTMCKNVFAPVFALTLIFILGGKPEEKLVFHLLIKLFYLSADS